MIVLRGQMAPHLMQKIRIILANGLKLHDAGNVDSTHRCIFLYNSGSHQTILLWQDDTRLYDELGSAARYGHMIQTMRTTKSAQGKAAEIMALGRDMVELGRI